MGLRLLKKKQRQMQNLFHPLKETMDNQMGFLCSAAVVYHSPHMLNCSHHDNFGPQS